METMTIVYILIGFVVGGIITAIIKKGGKATGISEEDFSAVQNEKDDIAKKLSDTEKERDGLCAKLSDAQKNAEEEKGNLITKYETLIKKAKEQCNELDKNLKNALEGKIDESIRVKLEEAEKLKKEIEDLEDEIEDNEDEISSLNKKLKTKNEELSKAEDDLFKEQKVSKQLYADLNEAKEELKNKIEELNIKISSLNFIQELLSASEINNDDDSKKIFKNINFMESFIKGDLINLYSFLVTSEYITYNEKSGNKALEMVKKDLNDNFELWASTKRKSWLDGKTTIAFVGEFSAGKTSIVNRILSQDDPNVPKLPVSMKATTAVPTYIAGAPAVSYSFISGDGKRKQILEETFKKVSKEVLDQIKGISSLIKYFVMTYKNHNLDGLSILDTPGFNSNDKEDRERTIDVINECDALFWVVDVNVGELNKSSVAIIKEKLNKPLYIVINKTDTKSESETDAVKKRINETLKNAELHAEQIITFSSKAPLENIMNPIKCVKRTDVRDTFVSDVNDSLNQLQDIMRNSVKECNDQYNKAQNEGNSITNQFVECMKDMNDDCVKASNIPHWEEHFLSKDRYEMDAEEGNSLLELLQNISVNHIQNLADKYDQQMEKVQEIQQAWSDLCDLKSALQKTEECYKQYKKISKDFN